MSNMTKKEKERRYLEMFADDIGRPELNTSADSEEPDFVYSPQDLGIEFAEMVVDHGSGPKGKGSAIKRDESSFDHFTARANEEFAARGPLRSAAVHVHELEGVERSRNDAEAAAVELLELVERELAHVPDDALGEKTIFKAWEAPSASRLALFAERVSLHVSPAFPKKVHLATPRLGYGQACVQPGLEALIIEKERKRAKSYTAKCSRNWLVLYSPGPSAASFVDLPFFSGAGIPANGFDSIYLLDVFSRRARLVWQNGAPVETAA